MVCDFVLASLFFLFFYFREYKILNLVKSLRFVSWIFFLKKNRRWKKKKRENYIYSTALDKFR